MSPATAARLRKLRCFAPVFVALLLTDCASKRIAEAELPPPHVPHAVVGDLVRFTLAYNPGAAMNLTAGLHSREVFTIVALMALVGLAALYRHTPAGATLSLVGLALVSAGALGNALDRWRPAAAVVDFIDVGVGGLRFWVFNVADAGICLGVLALVLANTRRAGPAAG
jgi:signal peptidase II